MRVTVRSISGFEGYDYWEETIVEVNGKVIGGGTYGGEPEDNRRYRDYAWVEDTITSLAKHLGADVEFITIEEST